MGSGKEIVVIRKGALQLVIDLFYKQMDNLQALPL